jgi:hypothetical protein
MAKSNKENQQEAHGPEKHNLQPNYKQQQSSESTKQSNLLPPSVVASTQDR